jgi:DNA-binding GntR family transcriptional regulator
MPERNDAVYQAIKARAITYAFPPGRRILLGLLAENLNTTRHQVREALLRLVTEGWAIQAPNKGFLAIGLDATTLAEYHDVNLSLLTSALRAAESGQPVRTNTLTIADTILHQLNRIDRDNECLATLIGQLFYAIAALGGNRVTMQLVERCNEHLYFIRTQECQYFGDATEELMALCELAVGQHFSELKQAIIDYHNRRNRFRQARSVFGQPSTPIKDVCRQTLSITGSCS